MEIGKEKGAGKNVFEKWVVPSPAPFIVSTIFFIRKSKSTKINIIKIKKYEH
jgi:hypothetical protein